MHICVYLYNYIYICTFETRVFLFREGLHYFHPVQKIVLFNIKLVFPQLKEQN